MSRPSSQKRRPAILATSVAVLFSLGFLLGAQKAAADEYWDGTNTGGSGTANGFGGIGNWDNTPANTNWVDSSGNNPQVYNPNDIAHFAGATAGTVTLGDNITFTTLSFDTNGYTIDPGAGPFKLSATSSTGTIIAKPGISVTINPQLTGSGAMDFEGSGTITVTNTANDYTGGTYIGSGGVGPTVIINSDNQLGNSGSFVIINGGTLETTGTFSTTRNFGLDGSGGTFSTDSGTSLQIGGSISGAGALTKNGSGTLQLSGSNSYTGGTNINGGTLSVSNDANLGVNGSNQAVGDLSFNNGTLQTNGNFATTRNVSLPGNAVFNPSPGTFFRIDGAITGSGTITVTGSGTLGFSSGGNTYTGDTFVQSGSTLAAAATNAMSRFSTIALDTGSIFQMNGLNQVVGGITGSGTIQLGTGGTLTAGNNNVPTTTFAGVIQDNGGLTKVGTGILKLTGKNTYTGRTTVNGGTLVSVPTTAAAADSALSSSSSLAMGGGTFQQNGIAASTVTQILNGLTINAGSNSITVNNLGTSTTLDLRGTGGTAGITHIGGVVDFNAATGNLDTTTAVIKTHQGNDANGMIGAWATVNHGAAFAKNDGSDHIVAFADSDYLDIAARGAVVPNAPAKNVRINSAGTTGPDTLEQGTTDVLTLTQNTGTDAVIAMSSQTLRVGTTGGFFITPTGANLTLGSTPNSGTVTAGGPTNNKAGEMIFDNNAAASLLIVNSVIADNGTGVVTVTIGGTGTTVFAGSNTYTGITNVSGGTLRLDAVNSLPTGGTVRVNTGATLSLNNNSQNVAALFDGATGGGTIALGSATLTIGDTNANSSYSGTITGTGTVVKNGTATLVLSGNSTYSGGTTLNSGTLVVNGSTSDGTGTPLGSGTLTINGGTLKTNIQPASGSSGTTLTNPISVHSDFSVGTNVNANNPGAQNFTLAGAINLNGTTRTITGVTNGGQVHFGAGGIGVGAETAGVNFNTSFTKSGDYVAFIFDPSNTNHYTGLTTVNNGAFVVFEGTTTNGAIKGNLDIEGNGVVDYINGPASVGQIVDDKIVTVNSSGNTLSGSHFDGLELRGASDTIGTLNGTGTVGLGSGTLTVGAGNFSGVIEDGAFGSGGSLVKNTTGTLILSGANTNTGATTVTAGTLRAGAVNTLSKSSAVTVASGATLDMNGFSQNVVSINGSGNVTLGAGTLTVGGTNVTNTFSGAISGSGGLTKIGTGTLTLNGTNTYTGATTVTKGGLVLSPVSTTPVLSSLSGLIVGGTASNDGGSFQLNGITGASTTQQVNGLTVNAGSNVVAVNNTDLTKTTTLDLGGITRNANGFVDFRATNPLSTLGTDAIILTTRGNDVSGIIGAWATVNHGSDLATNQGGKIVGLSTVAGGYYDIAATLDTVPDNANLNVRINSATGPRINPSDTNDIIASHPVTSINTLTQNFTTASTVELAGGTLKLGADGGILITPTSASLTIGATSNDGVLTATSSPSNPATITLANNSSAGTLTINSAITDAGGGPISVRLTGTGTTVLNGTNTYSGSTAILAGTLQTNLANTIPSTSPVTLNGGATLNLNNNSQTVASINDGANGGGNVALGTAVLTIGGTNADSSMSGIISGAGSLVKNGTGTLTLSGTNTYGGGTTLNSGRLNVNNTSALGGGTLTINGGTIGTTVSGMRVGNNVTGDLQFTNPVSVHGDFSIATNVNASDAGLQNLTFAGAVDLNGGTRKITGLVPGGQITFSNVISNGGVTFLTAPAVDAGGNSDYESFIYSGSTANTYTGLTTVGGHSILVLSKFVSDGAIAGDILVQGNGAVDFINGAAGGSQIANTSTVTVNSAGITFGGGVHIDGLDLRSASETIATLNGNSVGRVALGSGTLTIGVGGTFNGVIEDGDPNFQGQNGFGGNLTMAGTGKLILGGQSTYTGTTTISSGTIQVNTDNALPDGSAVTVSAGAVLDVNNHTQRIGSLAGGGTVNLGASNGILVAGFDGTSTTFSGVIKDGGNTSGTGGSFFKVGTGTLTLSGANTYSGETLIFAGTLKAGLANTVPSGSAVVVNGTPGNIATFDLNNFNQTIGSLSDGGSFGGIVKLGTATLTTGGDNTNTSFAGVIQDTGGVTKVGSGTFTLGGNNTYTGGTTLTKGGIAVSGSITSTVTATNTTGVTRLDNTGTITGQGGVAVDASAANNSGITIGDFGTFIGAVKLGKGANTVIIATNTKRTPISALTGKNDTLRLVGGGLDTLKLSDFSGYEYLDKAGGGQWNLTGTNPFSGGALVEAGTLNVRGSLISNTTISSMGTLSGTGFVTGNVLNSGIVNPGEPTAIITTTNKPGTLTLRGNYQQGSSGALIIQINGAGTSQFSHLAVSGRAQLDGGLVLQNDGNIVSLKLGQKLTFLTADGGVSGKFSAVDSTIPTGTVVVGKVVYDANTVSVQGAQGSFRSINNQYHLTANQNAVAATLDSAASDKRAAKLMAFLDNRPLKKLPNDFDQIAPEEMASASRLAVSLSDVQARNVQRRTADLRAGVSGFSAAGFQTTGGANYSGGLAGPNGSTGKDGKSTDEAAPDRRWGTFITGVGDFAHVGDSGNARGYDLNTGGVTVGADYKLTPHVAVGVTAGYAGTNANLTDDGRLLVNSGRVGVYGTYYTGGYYADAAVTGAATNYSTRRSSLEGVASGSTAGGSVDVLVNTGYDWRLDALTIGPTASFQYTYVGIDGFTEHGSLTPLRYAGQHQSSIRSNFGLRVAYDWKVGGVLVRPEATLAWQHEYGDRSYSIDSALASGAGDAFSVSDTQIGRDSLLFGAGVAVLWNPRTSTYLYYDADLLKKEYNSQSVSGGLRLNF